MRPAIYRRASLRGRALLRLLRAAWKEYERDYARYFAVAMVYYALVSMVPLILLLLAALGLLLRLSDLAADVEQQVLGTVESGFGVQLRAAIEQLLQQLRQQSVVASFVSLIGLLLTASALFHHLRLSFRAIWNYTSPLMSGGILPIIRATLLEKVIAFVMVLAGGALLVVALALVAMAHWLSAAVSALPMLGRTTGGLLAVLVPLIIVPLTFALLFKFLPPVRLRWRDVWLATALSAGAWLIGTEILALYGAFLGSNLSAYGAVGGVLVFMLWMNAVSQVLFYGAELCKVIVRTGGTAHAQATPDR